MKKLNLTIVLILGIIIEMVLLTHSFNAISAPDDFLVFIGVVGLALFVFIAYWLFELGKKIIKLYKKR